LHSCEKIFFECSFDVGGRLFDGKSRLKIFRITHQNETEGVKMRCEKPLFHADFFHFGFFGAQSAQRRAIFKFRRDDCWRFRAHGSCLRGQYTLP
jgi:hypothetical protein